MGDFETLTSHIVKATYARQGVQNMRTRQKQLDSLLQQKRIPKSGYSDSVVEYVIRELSIMDSNNFQSNCGVGEREGRVYSSLVLNRHYSLSHGIGRSGNIYEEQPKAAGSSIIYKLTTSMAAHALELSGFAKPLNCLILPLATGMTLAMCLLTMKLSKSAVKYVIWSRIDQKSCFKSIITAGLTPIVVDNIIVNGQMQTNVAQINVLLEKFKEEVLCVMSTTSCFAPRQPDLVDEIARLCKKHSVGHVINNAYGLQCPYITKLINRAIVVGRVDAVVQSTDKNFMVPVGGAIVTSPDPDFIVRLSKQYPGRANMSPVLDLFITLLSMGEDGLLGLWKERQRLFVLMKEKLIAFCASHGERLLVSPNNSISIGITLETLSSSLASQSNGCSEEEIENTAGHGLGEGEADSCCADEIQDNNNSVKEMGSGLESGIETGIGIGSGRQSVLKGSESEACCVSDDSSSNSSRVLPHTVQPISELPLPLSEKISELYSDSDRNSDPANKSDKRSALVPFPVVSAPTESVSFLGSMLFQRNVSGCRIVEQSDSDTDINGVHFISWGSHIANYPVSYLTAACSVGLSEEEIILFIDRLQKTWTKYEKSKLHK